MLDLLSPNTCDSVPTGMPVCYLPLFLSQTVWFPLNIVHNPLSHVWLSQRLVDLVVCFYEKKGNMKNAFFSYGKYIFLFSAFDLKQLK